MIGLPECAIAKSITFLEQKECVVKDYSSRDASCGKKSICIKRRMVTKIENPRPKKLRKIAIQHKKQTIQTNSNNNNDSIQAKNQILLADFISR